MDPLSIILIIAVGAGASLFLSGCNSEKPEGSKKQMDPIPTPEPITIFPSEAVKEDLEGAGNDSPPNSNSELECTQSLGNFTTLFPITGNQLQEGTDIFSKNTKFTPFPSCVFLNDGKCNPIIEDNKWQGIDPSRVADEDDWDAGVLYTSFMFCTHGQGIVYIKDNGQIEGLLSMVEEEYGKEFVELMMRIFSIEDQMGTEDVVAKDGNDKEIMFERRLAEVTARMIFQEMQRPGAEQTLVLWVVVNRIFSKGDYTNHLAKNLYNVLYEGGFESLDKNNLTAKENAYRPDYESDGWKNAKRLAASLFALVGNNEGKDLDEEYVRNTLPKLEGINGDKLTNELVDMTYFWGDGTHNHFS